MVHHGGAGTTAAGLKAAKPTLVCPFFGDQFFWGEMVRRSGAGCAPCPIAQARSPNPIPNPNPNPDPNPNPNPNPNPDPDPDP